MPRRPTVLVALILFALMPVFAAPGQSRASSRFEAERAIFAAFERGAYEDAAELIETWLRGGPDGGARDPQMLYNLACARSRLGQVRRANDALFRAVKAGFRDFEHMDRDPDLSALRRHEIYEEILAATRRLRREPSVDAAALWRRQFGEKDYRYETDRAHGLVYATALDAVSQREMRDMLARQADHLSKALFGGPPDYQVLVAIPTPAHARQLFGGDANVGGRYEHDARRLISRDIGGSLRHEFVHLMHYGHMERLRLRTPHPLWIQEGLASLYEDYDLDDDGTITFLPNERHNIVVSRQRLGRLTSWAKLFAMSSDQFMSGASRNYPQVRSIFEFLADQQKLSAWYSTFVENFNDDQTGSLAFEVVFGKPLEDVERAWHAWVRQRPAVDNTIRTGDAALGITSAANTSNDGVRVDEVLPGSAASRARIGVGDVIVSVDGTPTRSLLELRKIIGSRKVGDRVAVRLRRGEQYFTLNLVLRPVPRSWR